MTKVSWGNHLDVGPAFRWAWAGGTAGPRSEIRYGDAEPMSQAFVEACEEARSTGEDLFVLPVRWIERGFGALVSDMDSTLIVGESLDELAEALGVGAEVAAITAKSMRGDLDFAQALDRRFQLITGVHRNAFVDLAQSTELSEGAKTCIDVLRRHDVHCTLATGGFDLVAQVIIDRLGMHDFIANTLAFDTQGYFEGRLAGAVLDANAKLRVLEARQKASMGKPCLSMGDGANDLAMIEAAEVGIAYRAKPVVRAATPYQLNVASLADLPFLLGLGC